MTAKRTISVSILIFTFMVVIGVVGFAAAVGVDNKDDEVKADLMKLEGTWRLVGLEVGGKAVNPEALPRYDQLLFSGTKRTYISGYRVIESQFTINPSKTPKWIDDKGIYELKGDTLRLFFEPQGGQRPTEFKTREGTQQAIQTYERVVWPRRPLASGEVPLPDRIERSEIVVFGRVVAMEPKEVEAVLALERPYKFDFRIAVVKVHEIIHGQKDLKELRLGFVSPDHKDRGVDKTGKGLPALAEPTFWPVKVGQDGLFFLKKHHQGGFFVEFVLFNKGFIPSDNVPEFTKKLENVRLLSKFLELPLEALKAENASNRSMTATMLINRYRLYGTKSGKLPEKAIDAEESKLLLKTLAEADWRVDNDAMNPIMYPPHPYHVFLRLGVTKADGYDPPTNDIRDTLKYTQSWLRDNQEKYRIQRFSAVSK